MFVYNLIVKLGSETAGKVITKKIVVNILKKIGVKVTARQAAEFIPIIGQATAFRDIGEPKPESRLSDSASEPDLIVSHHPAPQVQG